jgi:lipopolysaccharide export system protein LptA
MRAHRLLALPFALALGIATAGESAAQAQPQRCNILENERLERREELGVPMLYVTGPFLIRCAGGEELRALQGVVNEWTREINLTGNVFFQDPTQTLTSQQATYWASIGRLYATGDVVFVNRQEGSTIRGPELEYYRPIEGRPEAQVNAGQRPTLVLQPRDRPGADPLNIVADRVAIFGENNLSAYGNVVIRRPDLHATGEEAQYDAATEGLELRQNARIQSERFDLTGQVVQARLPGGELEHVHARTDAELVGDELRVQAPDLQLFFTGELLQRAVARVPQDAAGERDGRAIATARAFRLEGDSIEAITPDQRVDQVIAIGRARGESLDAAQAAPAPDAETERAEEEREQPVIAVAPDATTPADTTALPAELAGLIDRDWIVGDTILGFFEPGDTTGAAADTGAVLRRIVARGMAQALYRVQQEDSQAQPAGDERRGVNFLAGELIELNFEDGELQVAEVTGLRRGVYLDPLPPGGAPPEARPPAPPGPTARRGGPR